MIGWDREEVGYGMGKRKKRGKGGKIMWEGTKDGKYDVRCRGEGREK